MISQPWLYDLSCEWRRWAGQRLKLGTLLLGSALSCALLAICLQLGHLLFSDKPAWVKQSGYFYSVVHQFPDGNIAGVNRQVALQLSQFPGVAQVAALQLKKADLSLEGQPLPALNILFYDHHLPEMLGYAEYTAEQGLWLSHRFWTRQLGADPNITGQWFRHQRIEQPLKILGVLPPSLDKIGHHSSDIWLPANYLRFLTPFGSSSSFMIDKFLAATEDNLLVIRSEQPLSVSAIAQRLQQTDLAVAGMQMQRRGGQMLVQPGLEFDPVNRSLVVQQWQLVLLFVVALSVVLILNWLTVYSSRLVLQQHEIRIYEILGADFSYLLYSSLRAALMKVVLVLLLSWLLLQILLPLMSGYPGYQQYSGGIAFEVSVQLWALSILTTALLLCALAILPLFRLKQRKLFERAMQVQRSLFQHAVAQLTLILQLTTALLALTLVAALSYQWWQHSSHYALDTEVQRWQFSSRGSGLNLTAIQPRPDPGTAWSGTDFFNPQRVVVNDIRLPVPTEFSLLAVSRSFFTVLGLPEPDLPQPWQHGVVLNQTAARLLSTGRPDLGLTGSSLDLSEINSGKHQVIAIVPDLPHQGKFSAPLPMIYISLEGAGQRAAPRQLFMYQSSKAVTPFLVMKQKLAQQLTGLQLQQLPVLGVAIEQQDSRSHSLLLSAWLIGCLIVLAVLLSLSDQFRARLKLDKFRYALQAAVGAPDSYNIRQALGQPLFALLVALPLAWLIQLLLAATLERQFSVALTAEPWLLVVISLSFSIVLLLLAYAQIRQVLFQPVSAVLRQDG